MSAVMVTSFTACGNDSDKEKGSDGNKIITFWSVFTGGDGTAMQKIIDAYNATNPEYTVEHIMTEQGRTLHKVSACGQFPERCFGSLHPVCGSPSEQFKGMERLPLIFNRYEQHG